MALSDLSSSQLTHLIELIKRKESLLAQLAEIDDKLSSLETGKAEQPKEASRRKRQKRRGKTSDAILERLSKAGKAGLSVKEIAAATGAKAPSIAVWLYTAGKKIKGLHKVARGRFAYKAGA